MNSANLPFRAALFFGLLLSGCASQSDLPRPLNFEAQRYLGQWYEVARLPVFYQPDDTLAVATYTATERADVIAVHNRSFSKTGELLSEIRGTARLSKSPPPGRLTVSFPGISSLVAWFSGPNYHVLWVNKTYTRAVVGTPSRRFLWILSRDVPLAPGELNHLIEIAANAGFNTSKILIAPWKSPVPQ